MVFESFNSTTKKKEAFYDYFDSLNLFVLDVQIEGLPADFPMIKPIAIVSVYSVSKLSKNNRKFQLISTDVHLQLKVYLMFNR